MGSGLAMIGMIGAIRVCYAWVGCTYAIVSASVMMAHCASAYSCVVTINNGPLPFASKKCRGKSIPTPVYLVFKPIPYSTKQHALPLAQQSAYCDPILFRPPIGRAHV